MPSTCRIRSETTEDHAAIDRLLRAAFESDAEAVLVKELRTQVDSVIVRVAVDDTGVLGFVMLSPVTIGGQAVNGMGLGPLAVAPNVQGRGIGGQLVDSGLEACRQMGGELVFVLGHPEYYRRWGFRSAADFGLHYRSTELDTWFMVSELKPRRLTEYAGIVRYHRLFDSL